MVVCGIQLSKFYSNANLIFKNLYRLTKTHICLIILNLRKDFYSFLISFTATKGAIKTNLILGKKHSTDKHFSVIHNILLLIYICFYFFGEFYVIFNNKDIEQTLFFVGGIFSQFIGTLLACL